MTHPDKLSTAKFRAVRLLLNKKHRLKEGLCLIEGRRFVSEALGAGAGVEMVLATVDFVADGEGGELIRLARSAGTPVRTLTTVQLSALSDTVNSQGVIAVVRLPGIPVDRLSVSPRSAPLIVGLDGVSDPGNVGTIIRTCAWFGAGAIVLGEGTAELSNPKLLRSTMGSVFQVPVVPGADLGSLVRRLKREGFRLVVADADGPESDETLGGDGGVFMIFGSEAHGVRSELAAMADARYGIRRYGSGESLNVAVAVGIALARFRSLRI